MEIIKKKLFIHLLDNAKPVDVGRIKHRNLENIKPGGLGVFFINEIMDEVKWKTKSNEWVNHLTMIKFL